MGSTIPGIISVGISGSSVVVGGCSTGASVGAGCCGVTVSAGGREEDSVGPGMTGTMTSEELDSLVSTGSLSTGFCVLGVSEVVGAVGLGWAESSVGEGISASAELEVSGSGLGDSADCEVLGSLGSSEETTPVGARRIPLDEEELEESVFSGSGLLVSTTSSFFEDEDEVSSSTALELLVG